MLNIDELYDKTLEELKIGSRPRFQFNDHELEYLSEQWINQIQNPSQLRKILCLVDHLHTDSSHWKGPIVKTLLENEDNDILIHTLGISHKQILYRCVRMGERLPYEYLECFHHLLNNQDAEVLEWTLRTIEQMGSQNRLFKETVLKRKPGFMRIFNKHLKNGFEIIEMLEKRWTN